MINSQILRKAKALIEDKDRWTGLVQQRATPTGLQHCALGALREVCGPGVKYNFLVTRYLGAAARDMYDTDSDIPTRHTVAYVNDRYGHDAVMDIYDRAIKMAEMEEEE